MTSPPPGYSCARTTAPPSARADATNSSRPSAVVVSTMLRSCAGRHLRRMRGRCSRAGRCGGRPAGWPGPGRTGQAAGTTPDPAPARPNQCPVRSSDTQNTADGITQALIFENDYRVNFILRKQNKDVCHLKGSFVFHHIGETRRPAGLGYGITILHND